jgi:chromosome segregation ATPase
MIEDMKYVKTEIQKLQTSIKKESAKEKETTASIAQYESEITSLRNDLSSIQIRKEKAEKHLDEVMGSLQESTTTLRAELEQYQLQLTESDRNVSEIQTEKESLEAAIKLVDSRSVLLKSSFNFVTIFRVQSVTKSIETIQAKLGALENEENEIHSGRSSSDSLRKNLSSRKDNLTHTLQTLRQKQTDLQSR